MAKAGWATLKRTKTLAEPLSGRPVAFDATCVTSASGRYVAILDALPATSESERDDRDALRVRVYSHDGRSWTELVEHCPKKVGYRFGDVRAVRPCVSDAGAVAFAVGSDLHVLSPSGARHQFAAPLAWPFFDPIDPGRLRLVVRRAASEVIETYDVTSASLVDTVSVGTSGGMEPYVDRETGDVLLFDGWYARAGGFVAIDRNAPGNVLGLGGDVLILGAEVNAPNATRRFARDGSERSVAASFAAFRRQDVWRARAPMLASADGGWAVVPWNGTLTLFDASTLEKQVELPALFPRHTLSGPGIIALLSDKLAIARRCGLFLVDLSTGRPIGDGPVALFGMAPAGDHIVSVHEDGLRIDSATPTVLTVEPRLDGLLVAPDQRHAAVIGASGDFAVAILDLSTMREVARVPQVASATWLDSSRLVVHGAAGLRVIDIATGNVKMHGELPSPACLGSDGRGRFFVGTSNELIERSADGAVVRTFTVPKKLTGYTWPSAIVVSGEDIFVLAKQRIFRWDAAGGCERLTAFENAIGGPKLDPKLHDGPFRSLSISPDGRWIAATTKTKSLAVGVVLADREGQVAAWTGPLFGRRSEWQERAWCVFRDGSLVVATEHGDIGVYELPTS